MCIIVVKPANIEITDNALVNMWINNPDGAGFMYAEGGRLHVVKGLMEFEQFYRAYRKAEHHKLVLHFRWRTHGAPSAAMTHPFWIAEGEVGMVHNGIISGIPTIGDESDTAAYVRVLQGRYGNAMKAIDNKHERKKIQAEIGWSKLVFMNNYGQFRIVGEKAGHWSYGCWWSNGSYRDRVKYVSVQHPETVKNKA
jgi:glutamine phosphoribosylpyrophosphate amidotransferase